MGEGNLIKVASSAPTIFVEQQVFYSDFLERDVVLDFYIPTQLKGFKNVSILLINDGQDLRQMPFQNVLNDLNVTESIKQLMFVGIHCGTYRDQEYGTECRADYKGRGARAGLYKKFVFDELLPFIMETYKINAFKEKAFAGFSLGGLSALDIVWNHPEEFSKVGVFSGSLWWRRKGYDDEGYNYDKDRIMHLQVQKGSHRPGLKFFFQTGLLDETADRNNNGIIDSIEDATELIELLLEKGYSHKHIKYLELEDGRHDVHTWSRALPEFLKWGWGKK